jgi:hypothetical protein
MYAGEHIDDPVADRTRKVQEWGVLTDWQKTIKGPMTYTLVAKQWAPTSRNYVRDLSTISDGFYNEYCNGTDPQREMTQEARSGAETEAGTQTAAKTAVVPDPADVPAKKAQVAAAETPATSSETKASGAAIAKKSIEDERKEGAPRTALGAGSMLGNLGESAKAAADQQQAAKAVDEPPVTLLNAKPDASAEAAPAATAAANEPTTQPASQPHADTTAATAKSTVAEPNIDATATTKTAKADAPKTTAKAETKTAAKSDTADKAAADKATADKGATVQTASIAGAATQLKLPAKSAPKCKVWTASYGGQRAVIIKASGSGTTNYTVLDVTDANENREVDAYIAAYANGGEKVGSFATQTKALNKAFELCPEG